MVARVNQRLAREEMFRRQAELRRSKTLIAKYWADLRCKKEKGKAICSEGVLPASGWRDDEID